MNLQAITGEGAFMVSGGNQLLECMPATSEQDSSEQVPAARREGPMMMRMMTKMKMRRRRIEENPVSEEGQATRCARLRSPNATF